MARFKPNQATRKARRKIKTTQWAEMNDRRYELIIKNHSPFGLTAEETEELDLLDKQIYSDVQAAFPRHYGKHYEVQGSLVPDPEISPESGTVHAGGRELGAVEDSPAVYQ